MAERGSQPDPSPRRRCEDVEAASRGRSAHAARFALAAVATAASIVFQRPGPPRRDGFVVRSHTIAGRRQTGAPVGEPAQAHALGRLGSPFCQIVAWRARGR